MSSEDPKTPDFSQILQTAQRVREKIQNVQDELARVTVQGSAGGGMVEATVNGKQQLLSVKIDPEVVDQAEIGMLQDLVVAAVNQGLARAAERAQQEMASITGGMGLNIPGMGL